MSASGLSADTASRAPLTARAVFAILKRIRHGSLALTTPDGETHLFTGPEPGTRADLQMLDWKVASELMRSADIAMGECYRDGRLKSSDWTALLIFFVENAQPLEDVFYGNKLAVLYYRLLHWLRSNSKRQARKNISAHYDLSNDFYKLWLDPTMTYSSGVGVSGKDMEAAQQAKYDRILHLLDPKPGEHILEIGCGWGGFAERAAKTRGVKVTGITLSEAQLAFAQARMKREGLDHLVTLKLVDYRDVKEQFDHIASIEMFEAVGEQYWQTYFSKVHECLKPGASAVIQAITIAEDAFPRYRETSDFIREYIFPGGMLAPVPRFRADAERAGLRSEAPFMFGIDYADTLAFWRDRINAVEAEVKALGFDEKFLRIWRFYLCYCEAGFRTGRTDVMQIQLTRPA
ncbi:MAG: cyclopropane-fatty-acyl-phospholipid synthase family protein [Burkholderiales bacterium]|nr:cyclopropane-fatty-acyl-phospholipid synthase family protein [Burkholderiales bacterium]